MRRRQALRAALFLLGGAAATVAVAWGCVIGQRSPEILVEPDWPRPPKVRSGETPLGQLHLRAFGVESMGYRLLACPYASGGVIGSVIQGDAGWPLRCVRWTRTTELRPPAHRQEVRRGVISAPWAGRVPPFSRG